MRSFTLFSAFLIDSGVSELLMHIYINDGRNSCFIFYLLSPEWLSPLGMWQLLPPLPLRDSSKKPHPDNEKLNKPSHRFTFQFISSHLCFPGIKKPFSHSLKKITPIKDMRKCDSPVIDFLESQSLLVKFLSTG